MLWVQDNQEFRRQVKVWGSIRHPHIVRLYGFCEERMSLVYELMEGGNLENKLAVGGFPWHIRLRIAHEAALGLFYLHNSAHPILHRWGLCVVISDSPNNISIMCTCDLVEQGKQ